MIKSGIILDLAGFEVFESVPTKFGNGAHVLISKKYSKQKVKHQVIKELEKDYEKLPFLIGKKCDVFEHEFSLANMRIFAHRFCDAVIERLKASEIIGKDKSK